MFRRLLFCLLALTLVADVALPAREIENTILSDDEVDSNYLQRRREKAAEYRLSRQRAYPQLSPEHHAEAARLAEQAARLLEAGNWRRARAATLTGLKTHGFSDSAGALQHALLRSYLAVGDIQKARLALVDLVERFADYPLITTAFEESLLIARRVQASGPLIDLRADHPSETILKKNSGNLERANLMLRYLARVGDHRSVAPQAALLYARSLLIRGSSYKDQIIEARAAYRLILDTWPESQVVFDALCELALSHLLMYRGDLYDVGALINAAGIIHRAKIYIGDSLDREETIRQYEDMILHWHQDRDLQVARWYRDKDHLRSARYYYQQSIAHDPAAPTGIQAAQELARMPEPPVPTPEITVPPPPPTRQVPPVASP